MSEPVKCWIDLNGRVFVLIHPEATDTPAIAVPLDLLRRLLDDADAGEEGWGGASTTPAERDQIQTMIREMREEAPHE
jgi:hypothetical protein